MVYNDQTQQLGGRNIGFIQANNEFSLGGSSMHQFTKPAVIQNQNNGSFYRFRSTEKQFPQPLLQVPERADFNQRNIATEHSELPSDCSRLSGSTNQNVNLTQPDSSDKYSEKNLSEAIREKLFSPENITQKEHKLAHAQRYSDKPDDQKRRPIKRNTFQNVKSFSDGLHGNIMHAQ